MQFFVGRNDLMNAVSRPETLVKHAPGMADRFDAIKELRGIDDGTLYKGSEFRRVASLSGPLEALLKTLDPEFMKSKRRFYRWLDENPEYCTYDRRRRKNTAFTPNGVMVVKPEMPEQEMTT